MLIRVPQIPLAPGDRWMNANEISELFGVDPESVHRWRRDGKLTGYKVNQRFWFKKSNVNRLLQSKGLPKF